MIPAPGRSGKLNSRTSGLSQTEVNRVVAIVMEANCLDEAKLMKAREVFLLGQAPMPARILWPPHRTGRYAIWCACERLGIRPPGVKPSWDECGLEERALILAFDQTRTFDCQEREAQLLGAGRPSGSGPEPESGGPAKEPAEEQTAMRT